MRTELKCLHNAYTITNWEQQGNLASVTVYLSFTLCLLPLPLIYTLRTVACLSKHVLGTAGACILA